ncbi:MAG: DUF3592 domain-containing protein [Aridibacter sp.]
MEAILTFLFLIAAGLVLSFIGVFFWHRTKTFVGRSVKTEGLIMGFDESTDDGISYAPIIRFTTNDGSTLKFTDSVYSNPPGYKVGERVKIFYHQSNYKDARVAAFSRLYFLPVLLMLTAVIFFGSALFVAFIEFFWLGEK